MADKQLKVVYVGDASALKKTLGDIDSAHASLGDKLKASGAKISSAGKSMTMGLTLPIVAGFAVAISEATEFAQVMGQTQAALKSTGGAAGVTAQHVVDLSSRIGELSAQDGELVQAGENVLLTFTSIRNEAGKGNDIFDKASMAAANLSARMGTDLNSAMVLVGKAVNDPIKGLSALSRVGVSFTEEQKTMIEGMVEAGDTMGAQKMILAELDKEFGGSAKAAGDAASPFTKLKLVMLDLAQSLGTILMPMVKAAGEFLAGLAAKFEGLSPAVQHTIVVVGLVVAAVGPILMIVGKVVSALGMLSNAFGMMGAAAQTVFAFLLANPFVALAAAILAIGIFVVTHFREIKEFILGIWESIKEFTKRIWDSLPAGIKSAINVIVGVIKTAFALIKSVIEIAWNLIKLDVKVTWEAIKLLIVHPLETIWDRIKDFFQLVKPAWNAFWGVIKAVAGGAWDVIVAASSIAMGVIKGILNAVIMAINAVIRGFNMVPFHDDVPTIPHLATGTRNFAGGLALVGERGPEIVALPRGSAVTPNNRIAAAGGTTVIVNVAGSVISEKELMHVVRRAAQRAAPRNAGATGFV